ncbi:MAG: glycoside hydrolase family 3 protein [Cyanobacteria bacterium SIG28]|nr:glycoside hydrolase family 3 protein [Cyanobacteria bacterium SIG28]
MEKFVYQMFILGCENLSEALKKGLGGVIFFTKDINSEYEIKQKVLELKSKALISPFLSIDQEGGRVERTERIYSKRLSARYAYQQGDTFLKKQADEMSKELAELGFNLNFAPCIDVNTNPNNPIIGERAFSDNPEDVIKGSKIVIESLRKNNIIPCVKHFPGHGDADKDSHLTLPKIDLSLEEMERIHIKPFVSAIQSNIEMIMVAHLYCTCFDSEEIPASLSCNVLGYLRNKLNYEGVVISDDMVMKGVQKYGSLDACLKGINAGVDMFIFRNSDDKTLNMIDDLVKIVEQDEQLCKKVVASYNRIISLKKKFGLI